MKKNEKNKKIKFEKEKEKKIKKLRLINIFVSFFSIMLILFIFGCQMQGTGEKKEERKGIEINLMSGAGFIENGKEIFDEEPFRVGLEINNYDDKEKEGSICIWDNMNDFYGGIMGKECKSFVLQPKGTTSLIFPESGTYSYVNLPASFQSEIKIEINVLIDSTFTHAVSYPDPQKESFTFSDNIISFSVSKSIHPTDEGYQIILEVSTGSVKNYKIKTGEKENIISFSISAKPLVFDCRTPKQKFTESALINITSEKLITCSANINSRAQESLPLIIKTRYIASKEERINFYIKKKSEI